MPIKLRNLKAKKPIKYFLVTYGCTLNQTDSNLMRGVLGKNGCVEVDNEKQADVVILNSCTVKEATENKIDYKLKAYAKARKPLVLAGCLSVNEKLVRKANPLCPIVGTASVSKIYDAVVCALDHTPQVFKEISSKEYLPRQRKGIIGKVAIAEGCLSNCSFCQTRLARGKLFSYPPSSIENEVVKWLQSGAVEIQLTAQDTGAYGAEIGENIAKLLGQVCSVEGDFHLRLGMINPEHALKYLPALLVSFEHPKMYKFLHLPVQSGSDRVLKAMKRKYTIAQFTQVTNAFRKKFPNMILATDVIVGFPGETQEDFEKTLALIRTIRFDVVNVSKYSARPFTPAKLMRQVPNNTKKKRAEICASLCHKIALENNSRFLGATLNAVITEKQKTLTGRDENYRQVALPAGFAASLGSKVKAKVIGYRIGCVIGKPQE